MDTLEHLKAHLGGKVAILGIGSSLRCDDAAGSIIAASIKDKVAYTVYDSGPAPENYFGKIIKDQPETVIIIDAADFGGKPGEIRFFEAQDLAGVNLYSTHNAPLGLAINYLKNNISVDIMLLGIQPKKTSFGDTLSPEVDGAVKQLTQWFSQTAKISGPKIISEKENT